MADHPLWTDWVTSISTAATVIATSIAGWAAARVYRREVQKEMPVIEPNLSWKIDPKLGRYIDVEMKIVNRLDETLIIDSAEIQTPRSAAIGIADYKVDASGRSRYLPVPSSEQKVSLLWEVQESGSYNMTVFDRTARSDLVWRHLYIFPPHSWNSGVIRFALRISSKALTIRDKRITIKRRIAAMTAREAQDNANKIS